MALSTQMEWMGWTADGDLSTWVCTVPGMMEALKIVMRLRWVIFLAVLAVAWMTFKPVAYVLTALICCVAPIDLLMALAGSRRRVDRARRDQVKAESRRLIDQS